MLFKEGDASKVVTPLGRRRLLTNSSSQPQFVISSPQNSRKPKMPGLARKKKVSVPDLHLNSSSVEPGPFQDDPHCHLIKEQVSSVLSSLLNQWLRCTSLAHTIGPDFCFQSAIAECDTCI